MVQWTIFSLTLEIREGFFVRDCHWFTYSWLWQTYGVCEGKALYFSLFEGMKIYVFYNLCTSNTLRKSKLSVVKSLDELQFYLRLRFLGYF